MNPTTTRTLLSLALATLGAGALAQDSFVGYSAHGALGTETYQKDYQGEMSAGMLEDGLLVQGLGSSSARANAGFGVNKAAVAIRGFDAANPVAYAFAQAESKYQDSFTIDVEGLTGTRGTFTTQLRVDGSGAFDIDGAIVADSDATVRGTWSAEVRLYADIADSHEDIPFIQSDNYVGVWERSFSGTELGYFGDALNASQREVSFSFVYGERIVLETSLFASLYMSNPNRAPGAFDASVDLGNSVYWGGIRDVRDASGRPIGDGYGYSSASGFDYRVQAVPEPASMVTLGVGVLGLLRRRKRA